MYGILYTLQETNISNLGKRKILFKRALVGDMLVPRRVPTFTIKISHVRFPPLPILFWKPPRSKCEDFRSSCTSARKIYENLHPKKVGPKKTQLYSKVIKLINSIRL